MKNIIAKILGLLKSANTVAEDAQQVWDAFEAAQTELKQGPVKEQVAQAKAVIKKYM